MGFRTWSGGAFKEFALDLSPVRGTALSLQEDTLSLGRVTDG